MVPYAPVRKEDASGYIVVLSPELKGYGTDDLVADATLMNQNIEGLIRRFPDQYLWVHRRFKTRPEGEPALYPPKKRKKQKH